MQIAFAFLTCTSASALGCGGDASSTTATTSEGQELPSGKLGAFEPRASVATVVVLPANTSGVNETESAITVGVLAWTGSEGEVSYCGELFQSAHTKAIAVNFAADGETLGAITFTLTGADEKLGAGKFSASLGELDGACDDTILETATEGTLTITQVTDGEIRGTADITFPSGHISGPFATSYCAQDLASLEEPTCKR